MHYGVTVRCISIMPDADNLGHVHYENPLYGHSECAWSARDVERLFKLSVAGAVAAGLVQPRRGDYRKAANRLISLGGSAKLVVLNNRLSREVVRLVWRYRPAIDALAAVLLRRRRLSGRQARQIVRAASRR